MCSRVMVSSARTKQTCRPGRPSSAPSLTTSKTSKRKAVGSSSRSTPLDAVGQVPGACPSEPCASDGPGSTASENDAVVGDGHHSSNGRLGLLVADDDVLADAQVTPSLAFRVDAWVSPSPSVRKVVDPEIPTHEEELRAGGLGFLAQPGLEGFCLSLGLLVGQTTALLLLRLDIAEEVVIDRDRVSTPDRHVIRVTRRHRRPRTSFRVGPAGPSVCHVGCARRSE